MKHTFLNNKSAYLLLAAMSFVFSVFGFFGIIEGFDANAPKSVYFGFLFLCSGLFFLSCYMKRKK